MSNQIYKFNNWYHESLPTNNHVTRKATRLSPNNKRRDALPEKENIRTGVCQVFIQYTSASITINEGADPTVRVDFETFFNKTVIENDPDYERDYEGPDDMPAHLKSSLLGSSVLIPIRNGQLALGTWQGIYLCEHRNQGGSRSIVITAWGQ